MIYIIKNLFTSVAVILILLSFSTCKKYPEDNFISLNSPKKRVVGHWKLNDYKFRSTSIMDELSSKIHNYDLKKLGLSIVGDKNSDQDLGYSTFGGGLGGSVYFGFPINKEEKTLFYFAIASNTYPKFIDTVFNVLFTAPLSFKGERYKKWDIQKLYNDKMNLQLKTDSGNYEIYFEKVK